MITMSENGSEGVLVVRNGVVAERVWMTNGVRSHGDEALALIRGANAAMVSARRLDDDAMGLLRPLLHGIPCYTDLRLEWVAWPQFLGDLCTRGQTFLVELQTPDGRGVSYIRDGRQVATFTESHPALGDASLLDDLAAGAVGTIRVLVDDGAPDDLAYALAPVVGPTVVGAAGTDETPTVAAFALPEVTLNVAAVPLPGVTPPGSDLALPGMTPTGADLALHGVTPAVAVEPVPEAHHADAMQPEAATAIAGQPLRAEHLATAGRPATARPITLAPPPAEHVERYVLRAAESALVPPGGSRPRVTDAADPNATFTAMFGSHDETPGAHRSIARGGAPHGAELDVASVLPQLRLLVHHRLQRSAESVEEIVENAATDHQSVAWLSDRVRVITMRGFLHSTFDQLADDMLALAGRDPD